jgi:hypothetical protein
MTRDALTTTPPTPTGTHCCTCGRWTTAPVVIGYASTEDTGFTTHHACPHHLADPGPCTADHGTAT